MRLIPVFSDAAFGPATTPEGLYRAAQHASSDEEREAIEEYAFDLSTILNLPTVDRGVGAL